MLAQGPRLRSDGLPFKFEAWGFKVVEGQGKPWPVDSGYLYYSVYTVTDHLL